MLGIPLEVRPLLDANVKDFNFNGTKSIPIILNTIIVRDEVDNGVIPKFEVHDRLVWSPSTYSNLNFKYLIFILE